MCRDHHRGRDFCRSADHDPGHGVSDKSDRGGRSVCTCTVGIYGSAAGFFPVYRGIKIQRHDDGGAAGIEESGGNAGGVRHRRALRGADGHLGLSGLSGDAHGQQGAEEGFSGSVHGGGYRLLLSPPSAADVFASQSGSPFFFPDEPDVCGKLRAVGGASGTRQKCIIHCLFNLYRHDGAPDHRLAGDSRGALCIPVPENETAKGKAADGAKQDRRAGHVLPCVRAGGRPYPVYCSEERIFGD